MTESLPEYPETRRGDVEETLFGESIADPYRWLENDVREDKEVAAWVEAQNAYTDAYLDTLKSRGWLKGRIGELFDFERYSTPVKYGGRYFYTHNSGLQNQSPLYVRDGLNAQPRLLLDPNEWAADGATALSDWLPSPAGGKLLYSVQDGGTDWRVLRVLDVATGDVLEDEIRWAKFTNLAWIGEEGFLYSRFPKPEAGEDFQALNYNQAVWYHRLGTPQGEDELVYATPGRPELGHSAEVTQDGRWVIITSASGTDAKYELHAIALADQMRRFASDDAVTTRAQGRKRAARDWTAIELVNGLEFNWSLVEGIGDSLWFVTNMGADRLKVVRADLDRLIPPGFKNGHTPALGCGPVDGEPCGTENDPPWTFAEIVPEQEQPIDSAAIVGDTLIVSYLKDASSVARTFDLAGTELGPIDLAGIGSLGSFTGRPGDPETFYSFTSFNRPATIYRYDTATGERTTFAQPRLKFRPDDYVVEQFFYASKDGTRVPMFVMRRKDLAQSGKPLPTLLYGYGGFDISLTPAFSASRMAWVEAGGAFALANIRGGGEYGKAWHDGGRLANKQNTFDDFIAAGEFLIAQGITPQHGLAIQGGSNGGLLVGAVVNQRPDLIAAGNAAVGVMDMLRFDRWTAGRYWVDDYGYPSKEADFKLLRSYSPLHNIRDGVDYPALIVTTADTDDRVVPGHSFKYTAALQAAELGNKPHVIRIETRAGHGAGKPTDKAIEEVSDILAFLAHWTGLKLPEDVVQKTPKKHE